MKISILYTFKVSYIIYSDDHENSFPQKNDSKVYVFVSTFWTSLLAYLYSGVISMQCVPNQSDLNLHIYAIFQEALLDHLT